MALKKGVGMSLNSEAVQARLSRAGERVEKHSVDVMRKYGRDVQTLAKLNVPVQDFHIEDSIVMKEKRSGQNRRIEIFVFVDSNKLRDLSGQDYDYSMWLHESSYKLGELSDLKDSISRGEDPRARVGNKYLERAVNAVTDDAIESIEDMVKEAFE